MWKFGKSRAPAIGHAIGPGYVLDLGMHVGDDTAYYLHRGYDVVAIEANPELCTSGQARFADAVKAGKLVILNVALCASTADSLEFHICDVNPEWSSLDKWRLDQIGGPMRTVKVSGTTLGHLLDTYGQPHYIKCDIEGADGEFIEQLTKTPAEKMPPFVSVEGIAGEWLQSLGHCGFDRVQLVNQAKIRRAFDPAFKFVVNGEAREWLFGGHSSGRFGGDLDPAKWISVDEALSRWNKFQEIKAADGDMTLDIWFDFHVTKSATLDGLRDAG
jgi:FkbM family methyltransferase